MQFQNDALLFTEIKVKLILLCVVAGLIWKNVGILYSGAVFCVSLTYVACSYRTDNYGIYSIGDIIQNLNQSCLWLDSWTSVSFQFFYVIRHCKTAIDTLPHFSLLGENAFAYILCVRREKDEKHCKRCCVVEVGRKSFWSFSKQPVRLFSVLIVGAEKTLYFCQWFELLHRCVLWDQNARSTTAARQLERSFSLLRCQAMR